MKVMLIDPGSLISINECLTVGEHFLTNIIRRLNEIMPAQIDGVPGRAEHLPSYRLAEHQSWFKQLLALISEAWKQLSYWEFG